jgi:aryl-alcohol dehydrogenase-like predicted oxidoreductase
MYFSSPAVDADPWQRGTGVQYQRLGSSGLKVSRIGLGMMSYGDAAERAWHLDEDAAEPIVARPSTAALHQVIQSGKARYIGASSMYAWKFAKAQHTADTHGWTRFASMQNHYNLVYREEEREMIPLCLDQGVGVIPYSPLARGLLAGSRERGGARRTLRSGSDPLAGDMYTDADFDVVDAVRQVAAGRGVPPAQIALAWLFAQPAVAAPIVGATSVAHLDDAVAAAGVTLTGDEITTLEAPYRPHRVLGHS